MTRKSVRLRELIDYLIENQLVYTDAEFAKKIDRDPAYLSKVINDKVALSKKLVDSIINCFPNVNGNWILTGEGEMVVSGNHIGDNIVSAKASGNSTANATVNYHAKPESQELQSLRGEVDALKKQISELEILLAEEKERSQKYWKMIEKLTSN